MRARLLSLNVSHPGRTDGWPSTSSGSAGVPVSGRARVVTRRRVAILLQGASARKRVEDRRRWGCAGAGKPDRPAVWNLLVFWSACCREQGVTLASLEFLLAPAGGSSAGDRMAYAGRMSHDG